MILVKLELFLYFSSTVGRILSLYYTVGRILSLFSTVCGPLKRLLYLSYTVERFFYLSSIFWVSFERLLYLSSTFECFLYLYSKVWLQITKTCECNTPSRENFNFLLGLAWYTLRNIWIYFTLLNELFGENLSFFEI